MRFALSGGESHFALESLNKSFLIFIYAFCIFKVWSGWVIQPSARGW
jgi:hypothetical protein